MPGGLASTINNWFPPKEKATATGVYIAATMFAPISPPLAVWIGGHRGWRVGLSLAILGIVWRRLPGIYWLSQNLQRADLFRKVNWKRLMPGVISIKHRAGKYINCRSFFTFADKIIREKMAPIDTAKGLFTSKNILGDCLAYFMMVVSVLYGWLTLDSAFPI